MAAPHSLDPTGSNRVVLFNSPEFILLFLTATLALHKPVVTG